MIELKNIKNIIFDLGGVLLDIDYEKTRNEFIDLFGDEKDAIFNYSIANKIDENFEKGLISPDTFRKELIQRSSQDISFEAFDNAWNAILVGFRKERIELIKSLKKRYNTFLLSNTNCIHYDIYTKWLEKDYNTTWSELFNTAWFSHHLHARKPEPDIYKEILKQGALLSQETLFIDDLDENLLAAEKFGIKTIKASESNDIIKIFG